MYRNDDPFLDSMSKVCEYCGEEYGTQYTALKLCGGRIRWVCWHCLNDIQKSEHGQDMTK